MELMKNGLAKPAILRIANALEQVIENFERDKFIHLALLNLDSLELKERVQHLITVLHQFLPSDFKLTAKLFFQIKPIWDHGDKDDALSSFAAWPIVDYVAQYGLEQPKLSLELLKELTALFSAEFAIRPFIIKYPDICQQYFLSWLTDNSVDVRRLVSEGTRPRLPWGQQLKNFVQDPTPNLILLETLKDDDSLYVRRSVANHLNDISKDHPDLVITLCKNWQKESNKELDWLIKHATRTLVKASHPKVFELLGYTVPAQVTCANFQILSDKIKTGQYLHFDLELISAAQQNQKLVIDFAIHFVKANNKQSAKVFKLKNILLAKNDTIKLSKKYSFKKISTRKYYSGLHHIEIIINGKSLKKLPFDLLVD